MAGQETNKRWTRKGIFLGDAPWNAEMSKKVTYNELPRKQLQNALICLWRFLYDLKSWLPWYQFSHSPFACSLFHLSLHFLSFHCLSLPFLLFFASVCRECRIRRKWLWPTPVLFLTHAFVIVKFTFVINGVISPISTWPSSLLVVSQRVPSRLSKMDVCVESHWGLLSLKSSLNFCNGSIQVNYGNFQWNWP